jgi:hypothetical protein
MPESLLIGAEQMKPEVLETLRIIGIYTAGRYDIWMLAGSSKASCRAHVMSVLCGVKTPQSKSGVNAIQAKLFSELGIPEAECTAVREDYFRDIARHISPYSAVSNG